MDIDKYKNLFIKIINNLQKEGFINLVENIKLIHFIQTGGTIVYMAEYIQIYNKLLNSEIDKELKLKIIKLSRKIFSHLYEINNIIETDNIKEVNIDNIIEEICKYNNEDIEFTKDQKDAIYKIINFLYNPIEKTFGLYGYAGTGKTTLITKLINFLILKNYIKSIVFTAPTNKAVNVIKSKFKDNIDNLLKFKLNKTTTDTLDNQLNELDKNGYKIEFLTIHKLLNFQNEYNIYGEKAFIKKGESDLNKYDLIIIDECSMISYEIINIIFKELRTNKNNINKIPKIIFVGDPAQLPPVNEKVSVIFNNKLSDFDSIKNLVKDEEYINFEILLNEIINQSSIVLQQIVRTNNNNIIGINNEIRNWITNSIKQPIIGKFKGNNVFIYKYKNENKINTQWFNKYLDNIKNNNILLSNIILTWTNNQTNEYNNKIRHLIFNKEKLNEFEIGDILILNDFYNLNDENKSKKKRFYTSEQIKIINIDEVIKVVSNISIEVKNIYLQKLPYFNIIKKKYEDTINIINKLITRKYNVWKMYVNLLNETNINNTIPDTYIMYVLKKESKELIQKDIKIASDKIKELRNYYSNNYKNELKILDQNIIKQLWYEMNKILIEPFAEVNYGTSITVHKSQGSTYYNVYVDIDDIFKNNNINELKRCIYTALTRTVNELHILI